MKQLAHLASVVLASFAAVACAADPPHPSTQPVAPASRQASADYDTVVHERARKIVETLNLGDPARAQRVTDIIANQYKALSAIQDPIKQSKDPAAKAEAQRQIEELHKQYLDRLASELDPSQVEQVKDGMTYNVANITYRGYLEMLPNLTEAQKATILSMLKEAREHAMDAGSSKEKHAWFGKYKGRINNYLAQEGYDLKQASKDWAERRKANADKKN